MTKLQSFALGMVLITMGIAALFQVIEIDPAMRVVSIEALGAVSILASMVFFIFTFRR